MLKKKEHKRVTIKDVAKLAGVSFKTVSRVVNKDLTVKGGNKEKVLTAIKELNYRMDSSARNLRSNSSFTLGLIYDSLNAFYIANIQNGVTNVCDEYHYGLQILPVQHNKNISVAELINISVSSRISGFIITPPFSENIELIEGLQENNIPFVRIISNGADNNTLSPLIHFDDVNVGAQLTEHLTDLGHKKIAFLWGQHSHRTSVARHEGYLNVLNKHAIPLTPSYVLAGEYTFQSGFERAKALLALSDRPTAIVASNDEIAAGAIAAASQSGIKIPEELSIVGVKSCPLGYQCWPQLTGIDLNAEDIASTAANVLISHLRQGDEKQGIVENIDFELDFVVRNSTAKVPVKK